MMAEIVELLLDNMWVDGTYLTKEKFIGRLSIYIELTPWLMEPGGSMPHSQGLSNNSHPEPNQPNYPH